MTNLLEETIEILENHNKTENDVLFCALDGYFTFEKFKELARNINYDSGYGLAEIADVVVVGDDWWLERAEYDGSEWWEFKTIPIKPDKEELNPRLF